MGTVLTFQGPEDLDKVLAEMEITDPDVIKRKKVSLTDNIGVLYVIGMCQAGVGSQKIVCYDAFRQ